MKLYIHLGENGASAVHERSGGVKMAFFPVGLTISIELCTEIHVLEYITEIHVLEYSIAAAHRI